MSNKEMRRRVLVSAVFKRAWLYVRRSNISFSLALRLAWQIIRNMGRLIYSKVRGVTKDNQDGVNRQRILSILTAYSEEDISLRFHREPNNFYDHNAIAVEAEVHGMGSAKLGFLSAALAREVAPMLDAGNIPIVFYLGVTGSIIRGLNFAFAMIPKKVSISTMQTHHAKSKALQRA